MIEQYLKATDALLRDIYKRLEALESQEPQYAQESTETKVKVEPKGNINYKVISPAQVSWMNKVLDRKPGERKLLEETFGAIDQIPMTDFNTIMGKLGVVLKPRS